MVVIKSSSLGENHFKYHDQTSARTVLDLAEFSRDKGIDLIEIFTNGTLISKRTAERIKELGIQIAISIYSSIPEIHDRVTQTPGSYEKTMRVIHLLKEAGVPIRAAIVVMKQNQDTIENTLEMVRDLGLNISGPDIVRPSGRGQDVETVPNIAALLKYGLVTRPNFSTDPTSFRRNQLYHPCLAGKLAITTDGKVIPCIFSRDKTVGDLRKIDLEDILASEEVEEKWKLTKDDVLVCRDCEYRYACFDCCPLAKGSSCRKDYSSSPFPRCTYDPYEGEWGLGVWKINGHGEIFYEKLDPI